MNIALWILQILLAVVFVMAGAMKLMQSKEQIAEKMAWANDFAPGQIKLIGLVELLGALGLVLPGLTGILPILTPLAAAGLALTMVGAAVVHLRRGEGPMAVPSIVLLLLSLFVAYGRFVLVPLS